MHNTKTLFRLNERALHTLSCAILVFTSISCGEATDQSEGNQNLIAERNETPEAVACRSDNKFWDPIKKECLMDVKLIADCSLDILKSLIDEQGQKSLTNMSDSGYKVSSCGQFGEAKTYIISWYKDQENGVEWVTNLLFGKVDENPKDEPKDPEDPEKDETKEDTTLVTYDFSGTYKSACDNGSITTIEFTATTFKQTNAVYTDTATCAEADIESETVYEGTYSQVDKMTDFASPADLKIIQTKKTATYYTSIFITMNNNSMKCGFNDWQLGVSKDTTNVNSAFCGIKTSAYYVAAAVETGILKMDGDDLTSNMSSQPSPAPYKSSVGDSVALNKQM
jgi:hypothetical protein